MTDRQHIAMASSPTKPPLGPPPQQQLQWRPGSSFGHLSAAGLHSMHRRTTSQQQLPAALDDGGYPADEKKFSRSLQACLGQGLSLPSAACTEHACHARASSSCRTRPRLWPLPTAPFPEVTTLAPSTLEEWGKKEAARCDSGDPDLELCELPGIINTPPRERSAADEAWSRGRCGKPPAQACPAARHAAQHLEKHPARS